MERFDLGASVRRLDTGERVAVKRLRWDDANGAMRLLGSMPLLPAGRYLLELRAEVGGAAAGFASADFEIVTDVDAPQVTLTRDFVELGEAVTGSVRTHGDHIRAGDEVVIRVRDCYERSIAEWCRPAAPRVDFEWRATDAATVTMAIEASILRGGAEVISARARFSVSRRHRGHWAQVMWDVPTDVLGYYGVQRLTEAGFNVNLRSGDPPDVVAAHNWSYIPYTTRVMDQFDGQGLMQPACWNDEPAIAQHVADIVSRQAAARRHGVYAYSLGDETTTRGACTHPSCLAAYRAWLLREYDDSIDALNAAWGSEYSSFEEIDLIGGGRYTGARLAYEEAAVDAGLYSRWADRQRFAQQNYVQLCARFGRAFNESDPWAVTGFEGAGNFGEDYAALATTNGFWAPYGGLGDEVLRSVAPRSMLRSNWIGYAREATPLIADAWRLVFNDCNSLFWWRWDNLGRFHGYLAPDLDLWPATRDLTEEMRIMRDGLGDWLMGADRQHDGIAIFYSVSSALATRTPPGAAIGDCERSHLAATLATADLGMGYDYITDEQVANGALRGGQYRVLWMPCTLAVSNEAAAAIAEFASSGGAIVADVAPGMWDEHLAPVERPALRRVFEPGGAGHLLGPEFAKYRDVRETVEGAAIRARLQDVCEETGVAPAVRLTYLDGPGWGVRMVRWRRGEIEVVGLLQLPLGTYDGAPLPPPATVRLALPERKHVSDVRSRSYLGVRDEIEVQLTPARAQFLVLLRREPQPLDVSAEPRVVEAGQPVRVTVSVPDGMRPRVVRLAVRSLSGRTAPWFSRTITVAHGGESVALQTAFNDERGVWTVSATDLLGRTADAEFQVR
ncbi:MAG: beta-galactosidase [Armatimonadota bacterium]|nr:MAG: beta-galactosidase [Armatimonadota bacterium]